MIAIVPSLDRTSDEWSWAIDIAQRKHGPPMISKSLPSCAIIFFRQTANLLLCKRGHGHGDHLIPSQSYLTDHFWSLVALSAALNEKDDLKKDIRRDSSGPISESEGNSAFISTSQTKQAASFPSTHNPAPRLSVDLTNNRI